MRRILVLAGVCFSFLCSGSLAAENGAIYGHVFEDVDGNGSDTNSDPRLPGVLVTLEGLDIAMQDTTMSDGNGLYGFTDLPPGQYRVSATPPPGSTATTPSLSTVTVGEGEALVAEPGQAGLPPDSPLIEVMVAPELVFGHAFLGSIHGYVYEDIDQDGHDDTEPRLPGIRVDLDGTAGGAPVAQHTTTDGNGEFAFADLIPGQYTIVETLPTGAVATTSMDTALVLASRQELVAEAGQSPIPPGDPRIEVMVGASLTFGNLMPGRVGDLVWYDINADSVRNTGEPGIPGVTVTVTWWGADGVSGGGDDVAAQTTTDAAGMYQISGITPGMCTAQASGLPQGFGTPTFTPPSFVLQSSGSHTDIDFGFAATNTIFHVAQHATSAPPYASWATAATDIQSAVDVAPAGATVRVGDGLYQPSAEILVDKNITIESVNGASSTTVDGQNVRRCFNLTDSYAVLSGFRIINGHKAGVQPHGLGGGVYCKYRKAKIIDCVFSNNWSGAEGGGCRGGTLYSCILSQNRSGYGGALYSSTAYDCTLTANRANYNGGGAGACDLTRCVVSDNQADFSKGGGVYMGGAKHCLIVDNRAEYGGGNAYGTLENCTVAYNTSTKYGGGTYYGVLRNCIVSLNSCPVGANWYDNVPEIDHTCTTPLPVGTGNISADPQFLDDVHGNYQLPASSRCIDSASTAHTPGGVDLKHTPRPLDGNLDGTAATDMGAYERLEPSADSDGDRLTDGDELGIHGTSPTSANSDGDPADDYEEYIADTDGTDASDYLRIESIDNRTIRFHSSTNRRYTLLWCLDLEDGFWGATRGQSRIPGTGGPDSLVDPADDPACSYRIMVELP